VAVKRPNIHKINQHLLVQDPPKFTQIGNFGFKIYHLATLEKHRPRQKEALAFQKRPTYSKQFLLMDLKPERPPFNIASFWKLFPNEKVLSNTPITKEL
jgi:hypothetical protein